MLFLYLGIIDTEENKSKFEQLYEQYSKLMFYVANQILQDNFLAEDAVHDAFIKIIENLDKIQEVNCHKTKSFIVIIVKNHAINIYNNRKKKFCTSLDEVGYTLIKEIDDTYIKYSHRDRNDDLGDLGNAIVQLPEIYKDVITLKYLHELTNQEIAVLLNINEATVRKRIERAKDRIQALLDKENKNVI